MPVQRISMDRVVSGRPARGYQGSLPKLVKSDQVQAKYKIEVMFSRHRSSLLHKNSPLMLLIWESGKRFHGGGDQKMYWCGYQDCQKPLSSDNFGPMHCVCPRCQRELFLGPDSRKPHYDSMRAQGRSTEGLDRIPDVVGERLLNLTPGKLADLLVRTWESLDRDADVYLKYSPFEIRYDKLHETPKDLDQLNKARVQRQPLIYTLKNIVKDLAAGADLRSRFLAMITS